MTATQAHRVLNVRPGADLAEIERAYRAALQRLQLQLVPGQPVAVRQKAQDQIAELKAAFEFLKNLSAPATPASGGGYARPQVPPPAIPQVQPMPAIPLTPPAPPRIGLPMQPAAMPQAQPVAGFPGQATAMPPVAPVAGVMPQPAAMAPNPFAQGAVGPTYPWVIPAGFIMAAAVMLFVAIFCIGSARSLERQKTARLRVLSVPWSTVIVDGTSLGPSGQVEAFAVKPGERKVVLRQGDRVLSRTVRLTDRSETTIKAQIEKGTIDVSHKPI